MKNISVIIDQYDTSIAKIEKSNLSFLTRLQHKIRRTQKCLGDLRLEVKNNNFDNRKQEIKFFKFQKPYIKGRLIFYLNVNKYHLHKPTGSKKEQRKFINLQLSQLCSESCYYIDFVKYYRLEHTKMDKLFFTRGVDQFELFIDNTSIFEDADFSSSRDHLAAKIIAHDLLVQFYSNELESLKKAKTNNVVNENETNDGFDLSWTASNTDLAELSLSLIALGAINNGNIEMIKIAEAWEKIFGIELGNIYNIFAQIKSRKKDPTKFLDKLKFALIKKLETDL